MFLYTLRIFFFLMLALGLVGGLDLVLKGTISWILFVPGYAMLSFLSYFLYRKALQYDPDAPPKKRKKKVKPEDRINDDSFDPQAEVQKRALIMRSIAWGVAGLVIAALALTIFYFPTDQVASLFYWIKEHIWACLFVIAVLISTYFIFRPKRKVAQATTTPRSEGSTGTTTRVVTVRPAIDIFTWWKPIAGWGLALFAALIVARVGGSIVADFYSMYRHLLHGEEPQQTTATTNTVYAANQEVPFKFIGFGYKWETYKPGTHYAFVRGVGENTGIHFHPADWKVQIKLYREGNPDVHRILRFDENYRIIPEEIINDDTPLATWYFTVDREVVMLVN